MTFTGNFNDIRIPNKEGDDLPLGDFGTISGKVEVVFRDIKQNLIEKILSAECVFGCVAWLTDKDILRALANSPNVALVVQKEDFLRPDTKQFSGVNKKALRAHYDALTCSFERPHFAGVLRDVSTSLDPTMDSIRCLGNVNREKSPAHPRMHNKFLIFCESRTVEPVDNYESTTITPKSVWTGSFNFSDTATKSFENAVHISDLDIANSFFGEWQQIYALSEPLDWEQHYMQPEWIIGT